MYISKRAFSIGTLIALGLLGDGNALLSADDRSIGQASDSAQELRRDTQDRPIIIVIICDDLGYGDLASYGHPHIQTPHLDQMAADGIRFTEFYSTAPVCSPSRVGLMTGRSPNRAGVYDWIPEGRSARPDAREQVHMRNSEVTIPKLLKRAGYATAMAGKWHCNSMFNSPEQPQPGDAGFDHWLATQNNPPLRTPIQSTLYATARKLIPWKATAAKS